MLRFLQAFHISYFLYSEALLQNATLIPVPIYSAREEPIEGICSEFIGEQLTVEWCLAEREELAPLLEKRATDVVVTFGAGNIDVVCKDVAEVIQKKCSSR